MEIVTAREVYAPVDRAMLFCQVFGVNNPPMFVLHGGPGLGQNYLLPHMQMLGRHFNAIFYDQRGTGRSKGGDEWHADPFATYVNDLEELRRFFDLKKVSLLAHSWGGVLATLYALAYPENVNKIIYVNCVPLSTADYMDFVEHRRSIVDSNKEQLAAIHDTDAFKNGDPETVKKYYEVYFKKYFTNPELEKELSLTMSREAALNNFKIYDLFYNHALQHPFELYSRLKQLNKSSLIIACDNDVIPLHYMERLHQGIPASEFCLIKGSGHFPYIEQPQLLYKAIDQFMLAKSLV